MALQYFVSLLFLQFALCDARAHAKLSGRVTSPVVLTETESPYEISADLEIVNATVTLKPGVRIRLHPRAIVRLSGSSSLVAKGTPTKPIVLTLNETQSNDASDSSKVRLVGGLSSNEGRLEVYNDVVRRWGTVCSLEWDYQDAQVVCRELGFGYPTNYRLSFGSGWGDVGFSRVSCNGHETSIFDCPVKSWNNNNCTHAYDVGVQCLSKGNRSVTSWGGLSFGSGSSGVLEHVVIEKAGSGVLGAITIQGKAVLSLTDVIIGNCSSSAVHLLSVTENVEFDGLRVIRAQTGVSGLLSTKFTCRNCSFENFRKSAVALSWYTPISNLSSSSIPTVNLNGRLISTTSQVSSKLIPVSPSGTKLVLSNVTGRYGSYKRTFVAPRGYGLRLVFNQPAYLRNSIRISVADGERDAAVQQFSSYFDSGAATVYSSKLVLTIYRGYYYYYYLSSVNSNVTAFLAPFKIGPESRDVTLSDCTFGTSAFSSNRPLTLGSQFDSLLVRNCSFKSNGMNGIIALGRSAYGNVTILSSTFAENLAGGRGYVYNTAISVSGSYHAVAIVNCTISGFSNAILISVNMLVGLTIANCTLTRNRQWAISLYRYSYYNSNYWEGWNHSMSVNIAGNDFLFSASGISTNMNVQSREYGAVSFRFTQNNIRGGGKAFGFTQLQGSQLVTNVLIANNTFSNNTARNMIVDIEVYGRSALDLIIEGNAFRSNRAKIIVDIAPIASYSSSNPGILFQSVTFRRNVLTDNSAVWPYSSSSNPSAVLVIERSVNVLAYHNVFNNPSSSLELSLYRVRRLSLSQHLNMTLNYWGTVNSTEIEERIYDAIDSSDLPVVVYSPYLLSPDDFRDVGKTENTTVYKSIILNLNGTVGGPLNRPFTLKSSQTSYLVTKTIRVLAGGVLTIDAGVTLRFQYGTGIDVEGGRLVTKGTTDKLIYFTADIAPNDPKTQYSDVRLVDESVYRYGTSGILQIFRRGSWSSFCLSYKKSYNDNSIWQLAHLACLRLGFSSGSRSSRVWYPKIGTSVVTSFSCSSRDLDLDDCSLSFGNYTADSGCLNRLGVYCRNTRYSSTKGNWVGLTFRGNSMSSLSFTHIAYAGLSREGALPAVRCYNHVPHFNGVVISQSYSSAISATSLRDRVNISGLHIDSARGDGISVRRSSGLDLIFYNVSMTSVYGQGIRLQEDVYDGDVTALESICAMPATLTVDPANDLFVGLRLRQHSAAMFCSGAVVAPGYLLSVSAVSLQLYPEDRLLIRDGSSANSTVLADYTGHSYSNGRSVLSSGSSLYIELLTGKRKGAPGFVLLVAAVPFGLRKSPVKIHNVRITRSDTGIFVAGMDNDLVIANSTIETRRYGVYVHSSLGSVSIVNTTVTGSSEAALYFASFRGNVTIRNNTMTNCSYGVQLYHSYSSGNNLSISSTLGVIIESNVVTGSRYSAIQLNLLPSYQSFKASVVQNVLSNNKIGCEIAGQSYGSVTRTGTYYANLVENNFTANHYTGLSITAELIRVVTIYSNVFAFHNSTKEGSGSAFFDVGSLSTFNVTANRFIANSGSFVVKFFSRSKLKSASVFINNLLVNNTVITPVSQAEGVTDNRSAVVVLAQQSTVVVRENAFLNFASSYELSINIPVQSSAEATVDATRNYWGEGVQNEADIQRRVYAFGSCSRLARVVVIPYLKSPLGPAVVPSKTTDSIVHEDALVSGLVSNRFFLRRSLSPYIVIGDVSVLPRGELIIEEGVTLRFSANTGILVEGRLTATGTTSNPIYMVDDDLLTKQAAGKRVDGSLRLVQQSSNVSGTLEIFYRGYWGAVCAASETNAQYHRYSTNHNYYIARVVCRSLFNTGAIYMNSRFHETDTSYAGNGSLQHVLCTGNEFDLATCQNYVFSSAKCIYGALRVSCYVSPHLPKDSQRKSFIYWSGVRFSASSGGRGGGSVMKNVHVINAGIANAERVAAIQSVGHNLTLANVSVSKSYWIGIETTNAPTNSSLVGVRSFDNGGSGIRLANSLSLAVNDSQCKKNAGHGLELSPVSVPMRLWNIPVVYDQIVDICSQSLVHHITKSFYLRFSPRRELDTLPSNCFITIMASPGFVPSFHLITYAFGQKLRTLQVDSARYTSGSSMSGAQHYTAPLSRMTVIVEIGNDVDYDYYYTSSPDYYTTTPPPHLSSSATYDPESDYILAYVEEQPLSGISKTAQTIRRCILSSNTGHGLFAYSDDQRRYEMIESTVSNNRLGGIYVTSNFTTKVVATESSSVSLFFLRNEIDGNWNTTVNGLLPRAGLSFVGESNVYLQNNVLRQNIIGLDLQMALHSTVLLVDNDFQNNVGSHSVHVRGGDTCTCIGNRFEENRNDFSDVLFVANTANIIVTRNSFSSNSGRSIVRMADNLSKIVGQSNAFSLNSASQSVISVEPLNGVNLQWTNNSIYDQSSDTEFTVSSRNTQLLTVYAKRNWWGPLESSWSLSHRLNVPLSVNITPVLLKDPQLVSSYCSSGWKGYDCDCHLYVGGALTWPAANDYCKSLGGWLATAGFTSSGEFFRDMSSVSPSSALRQPDIWLGLRNSSDGWRNSQDEALFDGIYPKWKSDAMKGASGCLMIGADGWEAVPCSRRLPFVCSQSGSRRPSLPDFSHNLLSVNRDDVVNGQILGLFSFENRTVNATYSTTVLNTSEAIFSPSIGLDATSGSIIVANASLLQHYAHNRLVFVIRGSLSSICNCTATKTVSLQLLDSPKSIRSGGSVVGRVLGGSIAGVALLILACILIVSVFKRKRRRERASMLYTSLQKSGSSEDVSTTSDNVVLTNADETDEDEDVGQANESVDAL